MLGKAVLIAGAGAAYVLRNPEARARWARLLQGAGAGTPDHRPPAPAELTTGAASSAAAEASTGGRSQPRLLETAGRGTGAGEGTTPAFVDRRPHSEGDGGSEELAGDRLLPDARPVEIARAVREEQPPG